ncbi:helix-turn-helix domain-containing protein [Streptomyces luteoverticillatus]|uniref:Helix-turn-helix domain-containing protein n=1 Tax=Streptomyces luteoverticillatus TaxID=66425 RepID=A0A3Q9G0M3_STRLT|nr:helix-turn-helix domain-containing protein [Streptomyces luteoverticillatus]
MPPHRSLTHETHRPRRSRDGDFPGACAPKWANRYRRHGELGLGDRSSTPRHQPTATPSELLVLMEELRRTHKWSAVRIAFELAQSGTPIIRETVIRHLAEIGINRSRFADSSPQR